MLFEVGRALFMEDKLKDIIHDSKSCKGSFFAFQEHNNKFFMANKAILTPTTQRDFTLPLHH